MFSTVPVLGSKCHSPVNVLYQNTKVLYIWPIWAFLHVSKYFPV